MIIKCKMCGGDLVFEEGKTVCVCEYCGSRQTIPNVDNEKKTTGFNRANRLRMNSEFDKAQTVYEQIISDFPEDAEAYWGLCLCKFGIEYVEDTDGSRKPTCHRTIPTSIFDDPDFENVMEYADSIAKTVYRAEAKEIERVQRRILEIAQSEDPYDVFICYKETDEAGSRTEDSVLAQDIYDTLTNKGIKVFFSRITLESKLGSEYEPYIYAALSSAKVMLAIGTDYDYFSSVWVKNEWSRFMAMAKTDRNKVLIPCYKGMDAYDLPREFKNYQAQDMGKLGWMQDLVRGVEKILGKEATTQKPAAVVQTAPSVDVNALLERAFMALEDGEWAKATNFCESVLNFDPHNSRAYLCQLMAEIKVNTVESLNHCNFPFDHGNAYQHAMRFGDEEQRRMLTKANETIRARIENNKRKQSFNNACDRFKRAKTVVECRNVISMLSSIAGYDGTTELLRKCNEKITALQEKQYSVATEKMKNAGESSAKWEEVSNALKHPDIDGYKDVEELRRQAKKNIDTFAAQEAAERKWIEAQKFAEEVAEKNRAKRKVFLGIVVASIALIGILLLTNVIIPQNKYKAAEKLRETGRYTEAIAAFRELGNYSDAYDQINVTYYVEGCAKRNAGDWEGAIKSFERDGRKTLVQTYTKETRYMEGQTKRAEGDWSGAVEAFAKASDYDDAAKQIKATYYMKGEADRKAGKWEDALDAFKSADDYEDASTQILETHYQHAKQMAEDGAPLSAAMLLLDLRGYSDVEQLLTDNAAISNVISDAIANKLKTPGTIVRFGQYEQDAEESNGTEPLEWKVLDAKDDSVLLISRYVIENHAYYPKRTSSLTWDKSEVRTWLNDQFIHAAFSSQEQDLILTTNIVNSKSSGSGANAPAVGVDTDDKVFLLSDAEVKQYMPEKTDRMVRETKYARSLYGATGVYASLSLDWTLRNPRSQNPSSTYVYKVNSKDGDIGSNEAHFATGVRPAMWVSVDTSTNVNVELVPSLMPLSENERDVVAPPVKSVQTTTTTNKKTTTTNYSQSGKKCPSCGKTVSSLITKKDKANVTHSWCSTCWSQYNAIMGY